jgi:hypothetical protein
MFERSFADYGKILSRVSPTGRVANPYNVVFMHDNTNDPATWDKYARRINRLRGALRLPAPKHKGTAVAAEMAAAAEVAAEAAATGGVVNVLRISHKHVHHGELADVHLDEIGDMQALDRYLLRLRPAPCYRICLLLCCTQCFSAKTIIPKPTSTLTVINLVRPGKLAIGVDNQGINVLVLRELEQLFSADLR